MIDDIDKLKQAGNKEQSEQQNSIENTSDGRSFQNIPAILPYEAKLALLKEIRHRDNRNLLKPLKGTKSSSADKKSITQSNREIKREKSAKSKRIDEIVEKSNKNSNAYLEEVEKNVLNSDPTKMNTKKVKS